MNMRHSALSAASVLALGLAAGTVSAADDSVPISTPAGITLVDVTDNQQKLVWRRLGTADGKPLYTSNADAANTAKCADDCAKEFPPFIAAKGAAAFGAWSFVTRADGAKQWAYQGQPLYTYSGTDPAGDPPSGKDVVKGAAKEALDFGSKAYSPKEGWKRAAFLPEKSTPTPAGIELTTLAVANGYGFSVPGTGMVMYVIKGQPKNPTMWMPVYAPGAAQAMGDFTILTREDSTQQWAYKGQRLYTYNGDYSAGDINGTVEQKDASVALATRHFQPAGVNIDVLALRGPIMTTAKGLTLYTESRQKLQYGGRESRGGYRYSYNEAKAVGTVGCVDDCLKSWKPLVAPANAVSSGFWEVDTRADGSKQWSYRGSPLYTFVDDKKPGDIEGNNRHTVVYGNADNIDRMKLTGGAEADPKNSYGAFGAGFYWHTVGLFN